MSVRIKPTIFQSRIDNQLHDRRRGFEDRVWAELGEKTITTNTLNDAAGSWAGTEREKQVIQLLARIVVAELTFRAKPRGDPGE